MDLQLGYAPIDCQITKLVGIILVPTVGKAGKCASGP